MYIQDQLLCPRCGEDELHRFHIIQCTHVDATTLRIEGIRKLSIFFDESQTAPDLKQGFLSLLASAISKTEWIPPPTIDLLTHSTFQSQIALGTLQVLDGFVSPLWASTQTAHYEYLGRRSTGVQWMSRVIRMIWPIL